MFHDWKIGQTGWVRLRNGKVARATRSRLDGVYSISIESLADDKTEIVRSTMSLQGFFLNDGIQRDRDAVEHLPDCDGFDWHPWKEGDWFVVDRPHHDEPVLHWNGDMDKFVGRPMVLERLTTLGHLKSNGCSWHPSWCRPCDPPKPKYRPFANAEEFSPHFDRRIERVDDTFGRLLSGAVRAVGFDGSGVWLGDKFVTYDLLLKRHFLDGDKEPCGVKV